MRPALATALVAAVVVVVAVLTVRADLVSTVNQASEFSIRDHNALLIETRRMRKAVERDTVVKTLPTDMQRRLTERLAARLDDDDHDMIRWTLRLPPPGAKPPARTTGSVSDVIRGDRPQMLP